MGVFGNLTPNKDEPGDFKPLPPGKPKEKQKPYVFPKDPSDTTPTANNEAAEPPKK